MDTKNFIKMSKRDKEELYGGFGWLVLVPFIVSAIAQTISSIKMMTSNSGSVKVSGYESHWDNKTSTSKPTSETTKTTNVYYAY